MESFYQFNTEKIVEHFKTSLTGLKEENVLSLQKEFGENKQEVRISQRSEAGLDQ